MGSVITNLAGSFVKKELGQEVKTEATKAFGSLESVAAKSEAGQNLMKIWHNIYEPTLAQTRQKLITNATQNSTGEAASELANKAANIARTHSFGKNDAILSHVINWAAHTNGEEYAQLLADHVAVNLHDTRTFTAPSPRTEYLRIKYGIQPKPEDMTVQREFSSVKDNILRNQDNTVRLNPKAVYQPRTHFERLASGYMNTMLAPFIAISHLSTLGTNFLTVPLKDLTKGLADIAVGGKDSAKQALLDTGIFNETAMTSYREMLEYRSGRIAKLTGSPTLGYWLNKAIHAPGFNAERDWTIAFAGTVGKHSVEDWAADAVKGDPLAIRQLERLGLNSKAIIARGGQLDPEEMSRAIYRFVDQRAFLNSRTARSLYSQANKWTRMGTMFHQYVSRQAKFMLEDARLANSTWRTNPINFIKTYSALLVAFPAIGSIIEGLEDFGRGQNGIEETKQRYAKLFSENPEEATAQYFDFMAHVGGVGILSSYTRGLLRNNLIDTLLGPVGNVTFRGLQDAGVFLAQSLKNVGTGKHANFSPFGRDMLEDTLPDNIGKILAHKIFPAHKKSGIQRLRPIGMKGLHRL